MKNLIKVSLFLAFVCFVSSTTLAYTYNMTLPIIKKNEIKKYKESLTKVIPGATKFKDKMIKLAKKSMKVSVGSNDSGKMLGFATVVSPVGYGGPIDIMVGISKEGKVNGIIIQNLSETPGLGTKSREPKFKNQFIGLTPKVMPKVTKDGGQIVAITAATISSRAVCRGVTEALKLYKDHKGEIFSTNSSDNKTTDETIKEKFGKDISPKNVDKKAEDSKGGK